jgi:phage-related protein
LTTIIQAIPQLINLLVPQIVTIVQTVSDILVENAPILLQAALMLLGALIEAIPQIALELYKAIPQIIDTIMNGLASLPGILWNYWLGIWNGIKNIFEPVTTYFSEKFGNAWETVKEIWNLATGYFTEKWEAIKTIFSGVGSYFSQKFTEAWNNVKNAFSKVGEFFGGIWDTIKRTFSTIGTKVGDAIGGSFKNAINAVIATVERGVNMIPSAVNRALDLINALPGVNIPALPTISLPRLARGGIVDKATLAEIGEDGAEAVLPLEKNKRGLKQIAQALAGEMRGGGAFGGNGNGGKVGDTIYNFNQTNNSPKALSRFEIYRQTKNLINAVKLQGV